MDWVTFATLLGVGSAAGMINIFAGSGSLITLAGFMWLGLPSTIANGTNRIGIIVQCAVAVFIFRNSGYFPGREAVRYLVPTGLGAGVGAYLATLMSPSSMERVIGVVMLLTVALVLIQPQQWQWSPESERRGDVWLLRAVFFAVGVYGGFIQAGVGILLISALLVFTEFEIIRASAVKLFIAGLFTVLALVIFSLKGHVRWDFGLVTAIGQGTGAWAAATYMSSFDSGAKVAYTVLILVATISSAKFLGLFELL